MAFRLRYLHHNLDLAQGEFVIGRSADCQLSLDDPLVSRRHAVVSVSGDSVMVRDLGSRNGVLVNGEKIDGPRVVGEGDKITIGAQEMMLLPGRLADDPALSSRRRLAAQTLSATAAAAFGARPAATSEPPPTAEATKKVDAFRLVGGLADKAIALGRHDEAERILSTLMADMLTSLEAGRRPEAQAVDQAGRYAARFAAATLKGSWVDYVVKLYTLAGRPCPAPIVDELYGVLRKIKTIDLAALRAYVDLLRDQTGGFGPAERFLLQRIEGLERLASLR
jgi:hypothetical protein